MVRHAFDRGPIDQVLIRHLTSYRTSPADPKGNVGSLHRRQNVFEGSQVHTHDVVGCPFSAQRHHLAPHPQDHIMALFLGCFRGHKWKRAQCGIIRAPTAGNKKSCHIPLLLYENNEQLIGGFDGISFLWLLDQSLTFAPTAGTYLLSLAQTCSGNTPLTALCFISEWPRKNDTIPMIQHKKALRGRMRCRLRDDGFIRLRAWGNLGQIQHLIPWN